MNIYLIDTIGLIIGFTMVSELYRSKRVWLLSVDSEVAGHRMHCSER
ncbi:MAG: hypothetical protein PHT76_02530 [Anaerostipes sp.]|nr:hypothetical protein [Anaerostipes sp.]